MSPYYQRLLAEAAGALKVAQAAVDLAADTLGDVSAAVEDEALGKLHDALRDVSNTLHQGASTALGKAS